MPTARALTVASLAALVPAVADAAHVDVMEETSTLGLFVDGFSDGFDPEVVTDSTVISGVDGSLLLGNDRGLTITYTATPATDDDDVQPPNSIDFPPLPDGLFVPDTQAGYLYRPDADFGDIALYNTFDATSTVRLDYLNSVDGDGATPDDPADFTQAGLGADNGGEDPEPTDGLSFAFTRVEGRGNDGVLGTVTMSLGDTFEDFASLTLPILSDTDVLEFPFADFDDIAFSEILFFDVTIDVTSPGTSLIFDGVAFTVVPEPGVAGVVALAAGLLARRRRT